MSEESAGPALRVWVVRDSEPLPTDAGDRRLMRAGMLSQALAAQGHETIWFTSTFDHYGKRLRGNSDQRLEISPRLTLQMLHAGSYRRNIDPMRIVHNRRFARRFTRVAATLPRPDVILTDIPTTEAALAAVRFAQERGIPRIVSIRDLWPDFFLDFLPPPLRPAAAPFIRILDRQTREACKSATGLIGISGGYLRWGQRKAGGRNSVFDRVFPLGYPALTPASPNRFEKPQGVRRVAFVGSWGKTYDLDLLLDTARLCLDRADIEFVIAGDSDSRPQLAAAFRQLPNVTLAGWLGAQDIADLLSSSDIGLLPYVAAAPQGLPNKCFEYMAYGTYQISTLGGELESLYADTNAGEVVPGDAAALRAAIIDHLDLRGPSKDRARIIHTFASRFSSEAIYGEMVRYVEDVARPGLNAQ